MTQLLQIIYHEFCQVHGLAAGLSGRKLSGGDGGICVFHPCRAEGEITRLKEVCYSQLRHAHFAQFFDIFYPLSNPLRFGLNGTKMKGFDGELSLPDACQEVWVRT